MPHPGAPGVSLGDPDLPEGQLVSSLQAVLAPHAAVLRAADAEGTALAAGMAGHARATLALRLLAAFPLTGAEGQALMRMTEALLRIPDRATAVQLLADELGAAAWQPRTRDP
ncbi:MAG: hypothetical protein KGQ77_12835, partial [Betaproteobacteria bacterium]|nr:hypothetical protein [Betaproteobacteria bacterium]